MNTVLKHGPQNANVTDTIVALSDVSDAEVERRVDAVDWWNVEQNLDQHGSVIIQSLLSPQECDALSVLYSRDELYRSRVVMERHGFGRGEYKYYDYPLPNLIGTLRRSVYPYLVPVANRWNTLMHVDVRYPAQHTEFIRRCHDAGQTRPTPLILQYAKDDYNCLHQDLYGEHVFPLQVAILLARPGEDFEGGEFVMTEVSSRGQKVDVVPLRQGDAVVFTVNTRPTRGARGSRKVAMRHGVSRIRSGDRHTVGLIFHDSK